MREAKARGEIARFPGGRRARGLPPLSTDPKVRKAQRLIEAAMAEKKSEPAWDPELGLGEKLFRAASVALDRAHEMLRQPVGDADIKEKQLVANLALGIIANQVRVDTAVLTQPRAPGAAGDDEEAKQRALASMREAFREVYVDEAVPLPSYLRPEPAVTAEPVISAVPEPEPPASESSPPPPVNGLSITERDERLRRGPGRDYARSDTDRNVERLPQRWRGPKPAGSGWSA